MGIEKVTMYKTNDGCLHATERSAIQHEEYSKLLEAYRINPLIHSDMKAVPFSYVRNWMLENPTLVETILASKPNNEPR